MLKGLQLSLMIGTALPEPVPADVTDAFLSAQVTQASESKSGFSVSFAFGKGSAVRRRFDQGFFDPPRRLVLVATVNGQPNTLMDGVITRHEVSSSNDPGQSRLTVIGEDISRLLDLVDFSWMWKYPAMPAEARVALILAKYVPLGIMPVIIPSVNLDIPLPKDRIPSHMGSDLQYLTYLANSVGYVFFIDPDPLPGVPIPREFPMLPSMLPAVGAARALGVSLVPGRSIAYWGPELKISKPQHSLIVNADAGSNVDSLSFTFDGFSKTVYLMLIRDEKLPVPIPIPIPDVNPLSPPLGQRQPIPLRAEPLRGVAKLNPLQAVMVGLAKAARAAEVISGSGSLNVMRYGQLLKARRLVEVRGAGYPHDGLHFVRSVTHNIKPGEYKQSFTLARNAFEPLSLGGGVVNAALGMAIPAVGVAQRVPGVGPFN
ncbi:hypothetical protein [Azotobacter chroococcum]|uniref:hypothetical protein n=1 Tax=Azotobacter chroococcum TaxID=353 RepID=UPI0010ADDBE1|nr:hypothetical protein [Azotobacter chroococcum]TKD47381.1 hypothetical protein FCG41_00025 [Azotobacter chroococcum]